MQELKSKEHINWSRIAQEAFAKRVGHTDDSDDVLESLLRIEKLIEERL